MRRAAGRPARDPRRRREGPERQHMQDPGACRVHLHAGRTIAVAVGDHNDGPFRPARSHLPAVPDRATLAAARGCPYVTCRRAHPPPRRSPIHGPVPVHQEHLARREHDPRRDGRDVLPALPGADHRPVPGQDRPAGQRDAPAPVPRLPRGADGHLHGLQALRAIVPDRVHRDRPGEGPGDEEAGDDPLRHRHGQMHVLRPLRRGVQAGESTGAIRHTREFEGAAPDARPPHLPLRPARAPGAALEGPEGPGRGPRRRVRPPRPRGARARHARQPRPARRAARHLAQAERRRQEEGRRAEEAGQGPDHAGEDDARSSRP